MLPAEAASRAAAREQFRHDVTRLWRGLLDAQQGDVAVRGQRCAHVSLKANNYYCQFEDFALLLASRWAT
jgi:hypothetical protein